MDTPRARSPRPHAPPSKPAAAPLPPPPPPPPTISAATSPSHDFSFASPFGGHLLPPLSMSRTPVGRVGSDLTHNYSSKTTRHHTTSYGTGSKDDDKGTAEYRGKNRTSPFLSGLGGAWRKESGGGGNAAGKQAEEKRKDKAEKRALDDVGQWVKRRMAAMVEQLRASFSRQAEKERRRRPHSFTGRGPNATREVKKEREQRCRRRRGQMSSAPASLRASPANSGHLSVGGSVTKVSTSSEESTMEELQSAIEAAIAHCKNSIAVAKPTTTAMAGDTKLQ